MPLLRERLGPVLRDGRPEGFKEIPPLENVQAMFDAAQAWHDLYGELLEMVGSLRQSAPFHAGRGYDDSHAMARALERVAASLERRL